MAEKTVLREETRCNLVVVFSMKACAVILSCVPAVTLQRSLPVFFSLRGNFEKFMQIRNFGGLLGELVRKILRFE